MKLEDQVCSLELAKRLKELGVKQDSHFYWWEHKPGTGWHLTENMSIYADENVSAFTVAELGEMVLETVSSGKTWGGGYRALFISDAHKTIHQEDAQTEADARVKMLIHLLENKLIPLDSK
jgi:hypothetical protein